MDRVRDLINQSIIDAEYHNDTGLPLKENQEKSEKVSKICILS